ncbi:MAG: hypothetical protein WD046_01750 [Paracoccaceae bacterium]
MARLLAFIIFIAALAAGGADVFTALDKRTDIHFQPIGDYWFQLHPDSLFGLQGLFEQMGLWSLMEYMFEFLLMPAAPTLAVIAIVLWILGGLFKRRPTAPPKPGKVQVAKNSTRARRNADSKHAGMHREAHTASSGPVRRMR